LPIFHKIHRSAGENEVLAIADSEHIGKTLRRNGIEFVVSEKFYRGEEVSEEELRRKLHEFTNINLVGEKVVSIAIEEGLASEEQVIKIGGIKHLQVFS